MTSGAEGSVESLPTTAKTSARRSGLFADSVVCFAVGIAASAVGLASGVVAAARLGPDGRGQVALLQIVVAASIVLGGLGLPDAIIYFTKSQFLDVRSLYLRFERLVCLAGLVFSFTAICVTAVLWRALDLTGLRTVVPYCLIVLPQAQIILLIGALRAAGRGYAWNSVRFVAAVCWLVAVAVPGVTSVRAVLQVHAILITAAWLLLRRLVAGGRSSKASRVPRSTILAALRFGAPSALIGLPALLNGKVDQIVVAGARSIDAAGVYSAAAGLAAGAYLLPQSVALVLFPAVASGRLGGGAQTKRLIRIGLPLCVFVGTAYAVIGYVAWPHLFGARFAAGRLPAVTLSLAWSLAGFNTMLEETLRGLGRSRIPLLTQSISAVSTMLIAFELTRLWGIGGAALGSLAGFATGTFALLVSIRRVYSIGSIHNEITIT